MCLIVFSYKAKGLLIENDRLMVRERRGGLVPRLEEILNGLGPVLPFREVVGKNLILLGQPINVKFFDRQADSLVKFFSPL